MQWSDFLLLKAEVLFTPGSLLQVLQDKNKSGRGRLGSFSTTFKESKKDVVRQVFLFTNHILLTTRASNGRLHLAKVLLVRQGQGQGQEQGQENRHKVN